MNSFGVKKSFMVCSEILVTIAFLKGCDVLLGLVLYKHDTMLYAHLQPSPTTIYRHEYSDIFGAHPCTVHVGGHNAT